MSEPLTEDASRLGGWRLEHVGALGHVGEKSFEVCTNDVEVVLNGDRLLRAAAQPGREQNLVVVGGEVDLERHDEDQRSNDDEDGREEPERRAAPPIASSVAPCSCAWSATISVVT